MTVDMNNIGKNFIKLFISHIIIFSFLASLNAQDARTTKGIRDLIELEYEMYESSKILVKDNIDQLKEIVIIEKLVELYCFEKKPTENEVKICEKYSQKLKVLDPKNIFIKCLDLNNDEKCSLEFDKELVLAIKDIEELEKEKKLIGKAWDKEQSFIDLRLKLEQFRTKEQGRSILKKIEKLKSDLNQSDDINKTREEIKVEYKKAIYSLCKTSKVVYGKDIKLQNRNFLNRYYRNPKSKKTIELLDSIKSLEKDVFKNKDQNLDEKNEITRVKILPNQCLNVLEDAYKFDSSISEIYCFIYSFIAPRCINSLNLSKKNMGEVNKRSSISDIDYF